MGSISPTRRMIQSGHAPVHLLRGRDRLGLKVHYVILCSGQTLTYLLRQPGGLIDLRAHVHLLHSGYGETPSAAAVRQLRLDYGVDYRRLQPYDMP